MLAASMAVIDAACPDKDDPARRHVAAARAWLEGDLALALDRYGALVADRPRDALAIVLAHAFDFRLGRRRMLRDRIAQVLPAWEATAPGYASILAMYAFGLEENGQYRRAERMARCALDLQPTHPGAIHVMAHVMEMQGRSREGLAFLAQTEPAWAEGTGFSVHLAWHRALFHLDANDPQAALKVYDAQIANTDPSNLSALADGSALLWRLELRRFDVGERWRLLADRWEKQALAGARVFYIEHAMMAFAAAGRSAGAARLLETLPLADANGPSPSMPEETLAPPFCKALLAFACGDYAACVRGLIRVRNIAHRCGGSLAQCDLIHLTFTEAALRARKVPLARSLVAERSARKPTSRFNRLLQLRLRRMPTTGQTGRHSQGAADVSVFKLGGPAKVTNVRTRGAR
jgi:tetratricopeptide (TPR) repeat protein